MTSLVLTRWRPDRPTGGSQLRNWQNIRCLAALGPVDVVTVGEDDAPATVEGVREWIPFSPRLRTRWDRLRHVGWPLRPGAEPRLDAYNFGIVRRWLRDRLATHHYDVAVIEELFLAPYFDDLAHAGCRVVFDAHNVEGALRGFVAAARADEDGSPLTRVRNALRQRRLLAQERRLVLEADVVWTCSVPDTQEFERGYGARSRMTVVPSGVDVEAYRRPGAPGPGDPWRGPITLVYPGAFAYYPNEDAAIRLITEVLPALRARGYETRVVLVGRGPQDALIAAARKDPAVEVTGSVADVLPYLEQPCVVTLPITLGGGTRMKIAEAFAVGRPVVSTAKGAEGLEAVDGEHLLIREEPQAMADAVIDLWQRPELRERLCANALAFVRRRYSWSAAGERIVESLRLAPDVIPRRDGAPCAGRSRPTPAPR